MKPPNPALFMVHPAESAEGLSPHAIPLAPWFHNLHLPDGRRTAPHHPLGDFPAFKWAQIAPHLPADLTGWTVLDMGCNAGFYTLEMARRGAEVTAVDVDPHFLKQARWAAQQWELEDRIQFRQATVYELAHWKEQFDLVLFLGVFYHLRYPLLGLDLLAEKTRRLMVFQTLSLPGREVLETPENQGFDNRDAMQEPGWPRMAFVEKSLAGDATNWWVPNHSGIEALLRSAGLRVMAYPGHEIYLCTPGTGPAQDVRERNAAELASATGQPRSG